MKTLIAVIALLVTVSLAGAEMYQWVDEKGVVTFKDTPPPAVKKSRKVKVYADSDFDPAPPQQPASGERSYKRTTVAAANKQERFSGTVEIYVTQWCGYCRQAREYMQNKGIDYVAYDIEKDSAARQRHKDLGGRGVPLIIIGPNRMSGFSPDTLEYYLNNSR